MRVRLADGRKTTVHVARHDAAATQVRRRARPRAGRSPRGALAHGMREALVGGFFTRPACEPLGELRTGGIERALRPVRRALGRRARLRAHPGRDVRLAARDELPARPRGDLLQAGPLLVRDGAAIFDRARRPRGLLRRLLASSTPTSPPARHPRAALALADGELLAVACDGRSRFDAGLTLEELAGRPRRPRRAQRDQPRRRRLDHADRGRPHVQPPDSRRAASRSPAGARSRPRSSSSRPESRRGDSNPWPTLYKSVALPTELLRPAPTSLGRGRKRSISGAMPRTYPSTPVWVKVLLIAAFAGSAIWWLVDRLDRTGNEERLGAIASELAGREVRVRCPGPFWARARLRQRRGQGALRRRRPARRRDAAERDARARSSTRWPRAGARRSSRASAGRRSRAGRAGREVTIAVDVLAHESFHLRGIMDEAETECRSLQALAWTAQRLGADAGAGPRDGDRAVHGRLPADARRATGPAPAPTAARSTSARTTRASPDGSATRVGAGDRTAGPHSCRRPSARPARISSRHHATVSASVRSSGICRLPARERRAAGSASPRTSITSCARTSAGSTTWSTATPADRRRAPRPARGPSASGPSRR